MADVLVTITILLTDNIRSWLQRAGETDDIAEIRSILAEIGEDVDQLVESAKAWGEGMG